MPADGARTGTNGAGRRANGASVGGNGAAAAKRRPGRPRKEIDMTAVAEGAARLFADGGRAGVHDPPDQPAPSRRQRSPGSPEGDGCAVYIVVPVSWRAGNGGECLIFGISDVTQGPVTRIELPFRPGWTARSPGGLPLLSPGCESGGGRALRVIPPGLGEGRRSRWVSAGSAARSAP